MNIAAYIFLALGGFFYMISGVGLLRMPCVYNRAQAATKATTFGTILTMIAVAILKPEWLPKLSLILVFIAITNPVGSSTLIKSAYKSGVKACTGTNIDQLNALYEKEEEETE